MHNRVCITKNITNDFEWTIFGIGEIMGYRMAGMTVIFAQETKKTAKYTACLPFW